MRFHFKGADESGPARATIPWEESQANIRDRRQELFVRLLSANYHSIYGFLVTLVGRTHTADDLMQEVSLLLWRKFDEFDDESAAPENDFLRWALVIARNVVRNFNRLRKADVFALDEHLLSKIASTRAAAQELLEMRKVALESCVNKLSRADRELLQACYSRDSTVKRMAAESGRTPNSLYKSLRRIRRTLFLCINKNLGLEPERDHLT